LGGETIGLVAAGLGSFLGVVALIPLTRRVALAYGITDDPTPGKLHTLVTPYLGGVAVGVVVLGASSFLPQWSVEGIAVLLGAVVVGLVGFIDDLKTLGPAPRIITEVMAASLAFAAGARVHLVGDIGDWIITVVWLVILTNAFNLLDNMDGAAGVVACTTSIALVVAAALEGQVLVGGLASLVAGACLGFLLYNWHPARIFLGDTGSLFIGFLLSAIALKLRFPVGRPASIAALILLLGPALFDTTLVVLSRWSAGRPIYTGGTDHTTHRLLSLGVPTRQVVLILAFGTALCAGLGVAVGRGSVSALAFVPVAVLGIGVLAALLRVPVYEVGKEQAPQRLPVAEHSLA